MALKRTAGEAQLDTRGGAAKKYAFPDVQWTSSSAWDEVHMEFLHKIKNGKETIDTVVRMMYGPTWLAQVKMPQMILEKMYVQGQGSFDVKFSSGLWDSQYSITVRPGIPEDPVGKEGEEPPPPVYTAAQKEKILADGLAFCDKLKAKGEELMRQMWDHRTARRESVISGLYDNYKKAASDALKLEEIRMMKRKEEVLVLTEAAREKKIEEDAFQLFLAANMVFFRNWTRNELYPTARDAYNDDPKNLCMKLSYNVYAPVQKLKDPKMETAARAEYAKHYVEKCKDPEQMVRMGYVQRKFPFVAKMGPKNAWTDMWKTVEPGHDPCKVGDVVKPNVTMVSYISPTKCGMRLDARQAMWMGPGHGRVYGGSFVIDAGEDEEAAHAFDVSAHSGGVRPVVVAKNETEELEVPHDDEADTKPKVVMDDGETAGGDTQYDA